MWNAIKIFVQCKPFSFLWWFFFWPLFFRPYFPPSRLSRCTFASFSRRFPSFSHSLGLLCKHNAILQCRSRAETQRNVFYNISNIIILVRIFVLHSSPLFALTKYKEQQPSIGQIQQTVYSVVLAAFHKQKARVHVYEFYDFAKMREWERLPKLIEGKSLLRRRPKSAVILHARFSIYPSFQQNPCSR